MLSRRTMLLTPLAVIAARASATAQGKMSLALHQNTSSAAGYQKSLEGWAKAGVRNVELTNGLLDEFLKTDSLAAARRILTDNGLTPVCANCGVGGLWEPNPNHATSLENLKKRCELFRTLGLTRIYSPTGTMGKFTLDDYKVAAQNVRAVGEVGKEFGMTILAEFVRASTFISTLTTILRVSREANHQNFAILLDFYHFWSGNNKLEDLDLLRAGEVGHVHFQDVPDMPRELLDNTTRFIPGDGNAPLTAILGKLAAKGYSGALSVELFLPKFQMGDPFEVASEIRKKAEGVMSKARVL